MHDDIIVDVDAHSISSPAHRHPIVCVYASVTLIGHGSFIVTASCCLPAAMCIVTVEWACLTALSTVLCVQSTLTDNALLASQRTSVEQFGVSSEGRID
jgi:hypothetical protein